MTNLSINDAFQASLQKAEVITFETSCFSRKKEVLKIQRDILACISTVLDEISLKQITLGIDEAFRNAYEHGNLGLNSHDKQKLLESELLEKELDTREKSFWSKKITTKLNISSKILSISIEDDGEGFNWKKMLTEFGNFSKETNVSLRGRGVKIMLATFDKITYNEKGNICYLEKKL